MPFINVSPFHEFLSGMNFILQINVGVVKLVGGTGTGKTTLLQELVRSTTQAQQDIVAFYFAPASFQQIKDTIRQQLNLDPAANFHDAVLNHLLPKPVEQRRLIVVFDNAEFMDEATLLAVGHLRSIQHAGQNLIGIVLCGRPELNRIIKQPEHRLLAKDILLSYDLSPLSSQQLPDFCRACLAARGLGSFVLAPDDYRQIMEKSGGLPGKVVELVETYWPEDPEISEPSVKEITSASPAPDKQQNISEPQTTAILENTSTVAEPLFFTPAARTSVAPDVTPVIAPDMSSEISADDSCGVLQEAAHHGQFASGDVTGVAVDGSQDMSVDDVHETPQQTSSDIAPGFIEISAGYVVNIAYGSDEQHATETAVNLTSEGSSDEASSTAKVSPEARLDFASGFIPDASYNSFDTEYETRLEIPASKAATDVSADIACQASPDAASNVSSEVAAETSLNIFSVPANGVTPEAAGDVAPASDFATVSDAFLDATYDVSPAPLKEVSFDFSSDTPVEIALGLASEPAATTASAVPQDTSERIPSTIAALAPVAPAAPGRIRIIVGALIAASVVVVIAQILDMGSDTNTAETPAVAVEQPPPATPPQTAEPDTIATVSVQQFGEATAASEADPAEIVPQPIATSPAQDSGPAPIAPAIVTPEAAQPAIASPANPTSPEAIAVVAEGVVNAWITAWQSRDVDAYLAFYHPDFVPPNGATRDGWENNRDRIISSQSSISIEIADFIVLGTSGNQTRVQFLLTYRGDNYADRTLKELTLQPDASSEMRIVQEQNLRTEAFDPVIEAASSWMPDSAAAAANENDDERKPALPILQQQPQATVLAAVPTEPRPSVPVARGPARAATSTPQAAGAEIIPLIFNLTSLSDAGVHQVNGVLQAWAEAWQSKDTERYFSYYHADYKALESSSVADWRAERSTKITAVNQISINLTELEILQNNDDNLLIELLMEYHADDYGDRTLKRMMLSRSAQGLWLITMENNVEVEQL